MYLCGQDQKIRSSMWPMTPKSTVLCIHTTKLMDILNWPVSQTALASSAWTHYFTITSLYGPLSLTPGGFFTKTSRTGVQSRQTVES